MHARAYYSWGRHFVPYLKARADEGASEKHYYVRVSKKDHYYQTLIVPIFLTDPYIVVIADRGRGEREGETLSWSEGEERERGRQVWGEGNKTQKSVEGGSVAEKHATLALISSRYGGEGDHCGGLCSPNEAGSEWRREESLTNSNRL